MSVETIRASDMPGYLREEIYSSLGNHAACFLRPDGANQPLKQCGSGTFVKYQGHSGILTSAHVVRALERLPIWMIALQRVGQVLTLDGGKVDFACTPVPKVEADGPDLGFVRLHPSSVAYLASIFTFVDLAFHQSKVATAEALQPDDGFWVEVGFPAEFGEVSPS